MERPVAEITCSVQVCARLEAILPKTASSEEDVPYCSVAHHDIAAVAAGQTISIIDVGTASIVAVLSGVHTSNIVKIVWSPEAGAYGTAESWGQRLASVDEGGKAVVWDVSTASPLTICSSVTERRKHVQQANMVIDMSWGASNNSLLVLLEPATFVMINADNGVILRSQTIAQGMVLTSIEVDSWQPSSVALTSMSQTLFTLRLSELPASQGATPQTDVARHEISTPGEGLTKVRWVPNRGLLLLMQLNQLSVYCIESKSTLTRMSLPAKYAPFSKWLAVQGTGTCLGTGDDGGANTLVCEHEGGSISVWHDHEGNLKYTLHCYHRLQPAIKSEALGLQSGIVSLVPCFPSFLDTPDQPITSSRPVTSASNMMWVLAVMSGGQLWRWRVSLPVPGQSFESLCSQGADTEPILDLTKTSPSIDSLIKLSPSVELNEPPQDSRALLAHSQSMRSRGSARDIRDLSGPLSSQTAPLSTSDSSGPLRALPRSFLVDSSKKSPATSAKEDAARTPSPMGRIDEQTEPPRTPDQAEPGSKVASLRAGGDAAATSSGAPVDAVPPSLEAVNSGLPAGATALSVFPAMVPTGDVAVYSRTNSRSGPGDVPPGTHSRAGSLFDDGEPDNTPEKATLNLSGGSNDESVSLLAVGTAEGTVEVVSVSQGAVHPLAMNIVHSFKVAATKVLSAHWLGTTLRFAAMTCTAVGKPDNQRYSYTVSVTDMVSTKTVALLRETEATEPLIALRTDPHGRYLAIMPRAGGLQVWCVPIMGKAVKVRTVELPFVAMAWVNPTPQESGHNPVFSSEMEAVAWPAHYKRQAASRQSSGNGSVNNGGTAGANGTPPKSTHEPAEAQAAFCFAVSDGRLGSITVTDRGVKKRPVTAPHWTVQYVDRLVVTSIAAMGDLVFIGDSEGVLYQWNTVSGQTMVVPAGRKVIRKISVGPPVPVSLKVGQGVGAGLARLVLLYGDGTLGVWDVHDASSLEGGRCDGVDKMKLPKFADAIWVPLPAPLSGGCVAAAISKNSGVTLLDIVDSGDRNDSTDRRKTLQRLVRGEKNRVSGQYEGANELMGSPLTSRKAMHLAQGGVCHSLRLMPPTVVTFLRLVFEAGVPVATLTTMGGGNAAERLAAAKSLCRFVLRIPKGASDNDQERSLGPHSPHSPPPLDDSGLLQAPDAPPLDATSLLRAPDAPPLDATSLLRGGPRGETLDATGLLPGREAELTDASTALPTVELNDAQAVLQAIDMQSLVDLVQRVCLLRTGERTKIMLPHEAAAYTAALESTNPRERACRCIAFAAALVGCSGEARFWTHLHATLAAHDARGSTQTPPNSITLFPYSAAAADAQRRVRWHEQVLSEFMPAEWVSVGSNPLSDRRMLEYVAIGDYASAAALMMTEAPAISGTFYRNSVLSIALAGVAASVTKDSSGAKGPSTPGRGFQVQTLKVVAEHAREIGDMTMCVVLLCAAGRYVEAVAELQAMDDWQAALSLAERFLSVPERNALLHARAKAHNKELSHSESIWRTVGLFTAAGSLRSAAAVLRSSGLTAAACNFTRICTEMGLICSVAPGSALEGALPESARAKIANPGKRSWLEGGDMTKRSNGLLRSSRGGEAQADAGIMLGWVNSGGTWVKEGAGEKGQQGLDPEATVLVNFDAPEPIGGGEADESFRKLHGEVIQDADRVAQMLSDQRQHVLYVLMELCKSRVW